MKILTVLDSKPKETEILKKSVNAEFFYGNIAEGYSEFLKGDFDYLVILKPDRWKVRLHDIEPILLKCIDSLAVIEHYALSQPAIIYGNLLDKHKGFVSQAKSHSYLKQFDDSFIVIKGQIARNFSILPFVTEDKIDLSKYNDEINLFGFESIRLNSCFLEVEKTDEVLQRKFDPYDSVDLINRNYLRNSFDVGIEFSYLAPIYNGTSEYAMNILPQMVEIFQKKGIRFQIIADPSVIQKFNLEVYSDYLIDPAKSEENFYHLLFIPQQIYSVAALEKINRICFKFVFTMLDVIGLRCRYLGEPRGLDIAGSLSYKYADTVLGLSKASAEDIEYFFNERCIFRSVKPVLLTKEISSIESMPSDKDEFTDKGFILVMGNAYKHKAIEKTLTELYESNLDLVILGDELTSDKFRKRFKVFPSGRLSNSLMDSLYKNSSLILYPSLYEGFGLPVLAALQLGKKILVYDSDVNRELKKEFDKNDLIFFFQSFSELPDIIEKILKLPGLSEIKKKSMISRTWKDVSLETTNILLVDIESNLDFNQMNQRIYDVREIRKILENSHWIKLHHFQFLAKLLLEIFIRKIRWYLGRFKRYLLFLVGCK